MKTNAERLYNGIIKENPTFVLMLGMCPTLAVTSSAINGIGMGLSTMVVLVFSNLLISLFRKIIPNGVRMPAYIVIVASLVTIVQFILQAFVTPLYNALGVYIPLIVVNCIILGRAESYASKNPVLPAVFDGIGMGLGFTMGLTLIGMFREMLGAGSIFDVSMAKFPTAVGVVLAVIAVILVVLAVVLMKKKVISTVGVLLVFVAVVLALAAVITLLGDRYTPVAIFIMAPGAFLVLACLVAVMNIIRAKMDEKGTPLAEPAGCLSGDCANCKDAAGCEKPEKKPESADAAVSESAGEVEIPDADKAKLEAKKAKEEAKAKAKEEKAKAKEEKARVKAEQKAQKLKEKEEKKAEAEARKKAEAEEKARAEAEAEARKKAEAEEKAKAEAAAEEKTEVEAKANAAAEEQAKAETEQKEGEDA